MKDNLVRDSENVIKMYLTPTGKGDAILEKNISLYAGSFQGKLLQIFVPKTWLFENEEMTFNYAVSVSALITSDTGKKVASKPYYLGFLKEEDEYVVFERTLPKEFTVYVGTTTIVANVINVDNTDDDPTMLDIITSQVSYLQVQESDYADGDEEIEVGDFENLVSTVTTNSKEINDLKNTISTGENYVTTTSNNTLLTNEQLNVLVESIEFRQPKNGDVIIFMLQIENETDKNYKYIYSSGGWQYYEIPPIETASNGSLGIIEGTFNTNDAEVTTTEFNVRNGKILNVYVKVGGQKKELVDYLENSLPEKYQTIDAGASKQFVKDYALPREFNDTYYISKNGYTSEIPDGSVQFSETSISLEDLTLFDLQFSQDAEFQLSSKNSCTNNIYISANQNIECYFRLTTYAKETNDWQLLSVELTDLLEFTANNIRKVTITSTFKELTNVLNITENSSIRQVLEVIPQSGYETTFSVYSNETFPSLFNLNTRSLVIKTVAGVIGEQPSFELRGQLENHIVTFEIPDDAIITNNMECELNLIVSRETLGTDILLLNYNGQLVRLVTPYNASGNATLDMISQVNKKTTSSTIVYTMKAFVKIDKSDDITFVVDEDDLTEINNKIDNANQEIGEIRDYLDHLEVDIDIDDNLSATSENPVQNKVITNEIESIKDNYVSNEDLDAKNYLTSIPSEYITETELNGKGFATTDNVNTALNTAKSYTDTKIADLIDSAPETLDTFKEIADAFKEDQEVLDALNSAIGNKADKSEIPTNYVTTDTIQEITGMKIFNDVQINNTLTDGVTSFSSLSEIQKKLSAGSGIKIEGNTISSTINDMTVKDQVSVALTKSTGSGANVQASKDLLTERAIATGLPYFNGKHNYTDQTNYFVPTTSGTTGQILVANAEKTGIYGGTWADKQTGGEPEWKNPSELGLITETELTAKNYVSNTNFQTFQNATNASLGSLYNADASLQTALNSKLNTSDLLNKIYPVGSVYMSVSATSPASFIGGSWTQIGAGYALWTATSGAGGTISAGLPNITGNLTSGDSFVCGSAASGGALYTTYHGGGPGGTSWAISRLYFDASRSNSIYGASSTVQPPAYKVYAWRRTS